MSYIVNFRISTAIKKMLALIFGLARADSATDVCGSASHTDCMNCFKVKGDFQCGWCAATQECLPGDAFGPFVGKCPTWHNTTDDYCKKESSIALPNSARLGILIGMIIIAIVTAVFWIVIFPKIYTVQGTEKKEGGL